MRLETIILHPGTHYATLAIGMFLCLNPSKDGFTPEDTTMAFLPNNARLPSSNSFNIKFSKAFSLGWGKGLTVYGDISNVFNSKNAKWADANGRIGGQLADPSAWYEPRRFSLGVRYEI